MLPLAFDEDGLVPVVVQDHLTGEVRMVAHATVEAVQKTLETGKATFWSRSRGELWEKGSTSGNALVVKRVLVDCDADCLLYSAEPLGPSCHTGAPSCFFQSLVPEVPPEAGRPAPKAPMTAKLEQRSEQPQTLLARLESVLDARKQAGAAESYTKRLYDGGPPAVGAKLREEADELARAVAGESDARVASEAADVLYHMLVALRMRGVAFRDVLRELEGRSGKSPGSPAKSAGADGAKGKSAGGGADANKSPR
jgi:phosphoribosyl-ATP pyrophosphohydrolase/phosphoribosyl-AMP cyclohydrolase